MIPYRTNRGHNRWTMWRHFGAGDMGNDGVHDIDYTRWGLGADGHPLKIVAIGQPSTVFSLVRRARSFASAFIIFCTQVNRSIFAADRLIRSSRRASPSQARVSNPSRQLRRKASS